VSKLKWILLLLLFPACLLAQGERGYVSGVSNVVSGDTLKATGADTTGWEKVGRAVNVIPFLYTTIEGGDSANVKVEVQKSLDGVNAVYDTTGTIVSTQLVGKHVTDSLWTQLNGTSTIGASEYYRFITTGVTGNDTCRVFLKLFKQGD